MKSLMYHVGFLNEETGEPVGLRQEEELENKKELGKKVKEFSQFTMLEGLGHEIEPNGR